MNVLLFIIAVPVVAIAGVCLLLYFFVLWLGSSFVENEPGEDHYHLELILVKNERIVITLTEDESDTELMHLNETWMAQVYDEETCLYRVSTVPEIAGLNGMICCYYSREIAGGVFLQVLLPSTAEGQLNTRLVFLDYLTLSLTAIDDTGAFFLYNDEKEENLIRGVNQNATISIRLNKT